MLFAVTVRAADFPALPTSVSAAIAKVNPDLAPRLASLQLVRADLLTKAADFDKVCSRVAAGSAEDAQCAKDFVILSAAAGKHTEKSDAFLKAHASASSIADQIARSGPGSNVLPKAVDDAIAGAYRNAPPEVSERVRKGFQAVQVRDWAVATAWFQDALNRDPGNTGLKRLVELTKAPSEPAAARLQLPNDSDVLFLFPGEAPRAAPQLPTPGPDDVYYFRPAKGYYRMTLAGARVQQLLDAAAGRPLGSIVKIR